MGIGVDVVVDFDLGVGFDLVVVRGLDLVLTRTFTW